LAALAAVAFFICWTATRRGSTRQWDQNPSMPVEQKPSIYPQQIPVTIQPVPQQTPVIIQPVQAYPVQPPAAVEQHLDASELAT
jgi:hypothetical protein